MELDGKKSLHKNFRWKFSTIAVNISGKNNVSLKVAHVTKYVMILLHLGYVSSYALYVFALCAQVFGQDLPKSKLQLKFLLKKGPSLLIQALKSCLCCSRSLSCCRVHKLYEVYLMSDVTLCCRCQRLNNLPGTRSLVPDGLDLLSSAQVCYCRAEFTHPPDADGATQMVPSPGMRSGLVSSSV